MALAQHRSIDIRFQQQYDNSREYLIPFIEAKMPLEPNMHIIEIGCGEGGVLKAFTDRGIHCVGVDLSKGRIERAKKLMQAEIVAGKAIFIAQNVYEDNFLKKWREKFDLIILKDTIEHIPEQAKFIPYLKQFLRPQGKIFFGFPPWYMPFGGHQQICENKLLGMLPYYHLLPKAIYKGILRLFKEPEPSIQELLEIKATGISIERFKRIIKNSDFKIVNETIFLINPIYQYKFGLKVRKQLPFLAAIPGLRNFVSTAAWFLAGEMIE